jgi:uncharacterized protein
MAKPTGAICNLDCEYCFYLSKEGLYPGSRFRMGSDVHEAYIRQLLEAHSDSPEIVVTWQGGEPTLIGLDFFRRSLELQRKLARPGQRILNTLQTNGTLLDDAWASFLRANDFLVGVSVDGPQDLHDAYRTDKRKRGTFDRVVRGIEYLQAHGVDWNVLACVHAANAKHGVRVYRFLRDELSARFIQFIPIVERADAESLVSDRSVRPEEYGRFLIDVFEEWVRRDIGSVYVQMFDSTLARWLGVSGQLCIHDETCGRNVALEHTGDVYSCDHFVEPTHRLGNIKQLHLVELATSARQQQFGRNKRDTLTSECRGCEVRFACNGGCPKDRFARSTLGEPNHNFLCASYLAFFRHVSQPMGVMSGLLASGNPPALLMTRYAAADRRRGRNAPCTCGSGRKWKHCHGSGRAFSPVGV